MTTNRTRTDPVRVPAVKLTSQLARGDFITIDGFSGFTVTRVEPYGSKALIRLAYENLAVVAERGIRWKTITQGTPVYLHGYQPCGECDGKGIIYGNHDRDDLRWDNSSRRWTVR